MVCGSQVTQRVETNDSNVCNALSRKSLLNVIFSLKKNFKKIKKKNFFFSFPSHLSLIATLANAAKFLKLSARTYGELVSSCDLIFQYLQ